MILYVRQKLYVHFKKYKEDGNDDSNSEDEEIIDDNEKSTNSVKIANVDTTSS